MLNSLALLCADLETDGIEITSFASEGMNLPVIIDAPELHPKPLPQASPVEAYPIFVIGDKEVEKACLRDGNHWGDTLVEHTAAGKTAVLIEGEEITDEEILGLLSPPAEEIELSMQPLDPELFIEERREERLSIDEILDDGDFLSFVLAVTEVAHA